MRPPSRLPRPGRLPVLTRSPPRRPLTRPPKKRGQQMDPSEDASATQAAPQPNPEGRNVAPATQTGPAVPPATAQVPAVPPPPAPVPRIHTQAFRSGLDASADQLEAEARTERKVEI